MNHKEADKPENLKDGAESPEHAQQIKHDATADPAERSRIRNQPEDEEDNKYRRRITK